MQIKLTTEVKNIAIKHKICLNDKILVLGSCFSDSIGGKLSEAGFDVCVNPFGALYNPESILNAISRLNSCARFKESECVAMGSGMELICSFSHHSSFARSTKAEFLDNANCSLGFASSFWKECNKVIVTLGSAWVWRRNGVAVANCLKRPSSEFSRELLSLEAVKSLISKLVKSYPGKEFLFTVSPIRHLGEAGAHANTISKSLLHLGLEAASSESGNAGYFPAYEILLDELRDYRFYASDLVHPSETAVSIIWERFLESCVEPKDYPQIIENLKSARFALHRKLH